MNAEYLIGIVIVCGSFALICLAIRWLQNVFRRAMHRKFVSMGGVPSDGEGVFDPTITYNTSLSIDQTIYASNIHHNNKK